MNQITPPKPDVEHILEDIEDGLLQLRRILRLLSQDGSDALSLEHALGISEYLAMQVAYDFEALTEADLSPDELATREKLSKGFRQLHQRIVRRQLLGHD